MCDLVDAVLNELKNYNVTSVNSITLVIGKMTNLGGEQMKFAYDVITRETVLEGSELIIEVEDIEVHCDGCGYDGPVKILSFDEDTESLDHSIPILSCPECNGNIIVTKGQSCCVKCMDIEEAV